MADRTCSVEGCERSHYGRGWCEMHWSRWKRFGDPLHTRPSEAQRFWAKVDRSAGADGCWLWTASRTWTGYGRFGDRSSPKGWVYAHRWAWEEANGTTIPAGLQIDHLCKTKECVNPNHLEAVTQRENLMRSSGVTAVNAAKTHCPKGHPYDDENTYRNPTTGHRSCRTCHQSADAGRSRPGKRGKR